MRPSFSVIGLTAAAAVVAGCSSSGHSMLVFGQTQTVGISIGGSVPDQGASFTLGYQDKNFAIVPATVVQADGSSTQVLSNVGGNSNDALSVLGQFEVRSSTETADVGLGKFFATGLAAQKLADGFRDQIAGKPKKAARAAAAASAPRP